MIHGRPHLRSATDIAEGAHTICDTKIGATGLKIAPVCLMPLTEGAKVTTISSSQVVNELKWILDNR